jgi:hypothetical protein
LCAAFEDGEKRDSDQRDEGHDCRVPAPATLGAFSGVLDERVDEGLELPVCDGNPGELRGRTGSELSTRFEVGILGQTESPGNGAFSFLRW